MRTVDKVSLCFLQRLNSVVLQKAMITVSRPPIFYKSIPHYFKVLGKGRTRNAKQDVC